MAERPILDKKLDEKTFRNFYYLKAATGAELRLCLQ